MTETFWYWILQFAADPIRQERRNVGVLVFGRSRAEFVALGSGPVVDLEAFRPLAAAAGEDLWVYGEWLAWFQALCRETGEGLASVRRRLEALEAQGLPFVARPGGELEVLPGESVRSVAASLYKELVDEPLKADLPSFERRVEAVVAAAGLPYLSSYEEQVEVEFPAQRDFPAQTVFFDYLVEAPPRLAVRCLPMQVERAAFADELETAVTAFRAVAALGFAPASRCVALVEPFPEERWPLLERLRAVARVVDVTSPTAVRRLRDILTAR